MRCIMSESRRRSECVWGGKRITGDGRRRTHTNQLFLFFFVPSQNVQMNWSRTQQQYRTCKYSPVLNVSLYWPGISSCAVSRSVMHRPSLSVAPEPNAVHEPLAFRFDMATMTPDAGRPCDMSSMCVVTGGFVRGADAKGLNCCSICERVYPHTAIEMTSNEGRTIENCKPRNTQNERRIYQSTFARHTCIPQSIPKTPHRLSNTSIHTCSRR